MGVMPQAYDCHQLVVPSSWAKPPSETPVADQWSVHLYIWNLATDPQTLSALESCALQAPPVAPSASTTEHPVPNGDNLPYGYDLQGTTLSAVQGLTRGDVEELNTGTPCTLPSGQYDEAALTDAGRTWFAYLYTDGGSGSDLDASKLAMTEQVLAQSLVAAHFNGQLPPVPGPA